jgi:hypothetical protein
MFSNLYQHQIVIICHSVLASLVGEEVHCFVLIYLQSLEDAVSLASHHGTFKRLYFYPEHISDHF